MFELEIEQKREETKKMAELQQQTIQKVLEENERKELKRKQDYDMKKALAEQRKKEIESMEEQRKLMKIKEEEEKERKRIEVISNYIQNNFIGKRKYGTNNEAKDRWIFDENKRE